MDHSALHHTHNHTNIEAQTINTTVDFEGGYTVIHPYRKFYNHAIPGSIFFILGMRWIYCSLYRYYLCQREEQSGRENPRKYENSILYPSAICPRIPLVNFLAIAASTSGLITLAFIFEAKNYTDHILLYLSFVVPAIFDTLAKYHVNFPKNAEYFSSIVATMSNALIFYGHALMKDNQIKMVLHMRIVLVFLCLIGASIFEYIFINRVLPAVARGYLSALLGIWFWLLGMNFLTQPRVLFPNTHAGLSFADNMFVLLMALTQVLVFFVGFCANRNVRKLSLSQVSAVLDREYSWIPGHKQQKKEAVEDCKEPLLYAHCVAC